MRSLLLPTEKKQEKLSLISRGHRSFALGGKSDTTIERPFT